MAHQWKNLLVEQNEYTTLIKINRESALNALNTETLEELSAVLDFLLENKETKGIIITGSGTKSFVAGADIKEFVGLDTKQGSELSSFGHREVMNKIERFPKPIIAAVNGFALGGGLELAMSCHIRVASSNAKLGLPEVSLGLIPGYGGTQRLTQLVGRGKALEMILTGEMISADNALQWGLVNYVEPIEELINKANSILEKIYSKSPEAVAKALDAVHEGLYFPDSGMEKEIKLFGESFESKDIKEGITAFIEKRKPKF